MLIMLNKSKVKISEARLGHSAKDCNVLYEEFDDLASLWK